MNFYALSALINFLSSLILGVFVLLNNRKAKTNAAFALFAFTVAIWSFGYYFWQVANSPHAALWWTRFLMAAAIFIPVTYLHFVCAFLDLLGRKKKLLIASYALFSVFLVLDFTPLFVNRVEHVLNFEFWPLPGPAYHVFLIAWFAYVAYSTRLLYSRWKKASGLLRRQIAYILVGMTIGFAGGATNYFLWYGIPVLPVANVLVSVYVATTAYAIVKHRLMNIKAIAAEGFSGLLLLVSFIAVFQTKNTTELFVSIVFFLMTAVFVTGVIRSVLQEIHQREQLEVLTQRLSKTAEELQVANKELARLDQAKTEFLSIASHQLRTPLTVMNGHVSMILDGSFGPVPEKVKASLERVYTSGARLVRLVETLLDISRIEAGRLELDIKPTDLAEIVQSLVGDFQQKAKTRKLKLEFHPEAALPRVSTDPEKIKEVVSNLIDNAIKYTQEGAVTASLRREGPSVVFACRDTGPGIAPEDLPQLFRKFVRATGETARTEGTGLGLYFARMLIENMGGRIWAESEGRGKGSTFSFSLPVAVKEDTKHDGDVNPLGEGKDPARLNRSIHTA